MTDIELGWTAGIIDGEGTIALGKSHQLHVAVDSCNRVVTKKLEELWGGSEWKLKQVTKAGNPRHRWQVTGYEARGFLMTLRPHLILKEVQAEVAIAFGLTLGTSGKHVTKEIRKMREELVQELQELKKCG